ncbi:MAG: hypothetical protein ACKO28_02860 [Cyanobium sp.]
MGVLGQIGVTIVVQQKPVVGMGIDVQEDGGAQPSGDGEGRQRKVTVVMPPAVLLRQGLEITQRKNVAEDLGTLFRASARLQEVS